MRENVCIVSTSLMFVAGQLLYSIQHRRLVSERRYVTIEFRGNTFF